MSTASLAVQDLEARVVRVSQLALSHCLVAASRERDDEKSEAHAEDNAEADVESAHVIPFPWEET